MELGDDHPVSLGNPGPLAEKIYISRCVTLDGISNSLMTKFCERSFEIGHIPQLDASRIPKLVKLAKHVGARYNTSSKGYLKTRVVQYNALKAIL